MIEDDVEHGDDLDDDHDREEEDDEEEDDEDRCPHHHSRHPNHRHSRHRHHHGGGRRSRSGGGNRRRRMRRRELHLVKYTFFVYKIYFIIIWEFSFQGDSFGITPTMEKLFHRGVMRTVCDDCQVNFCGFNLSPTHTAVSRETIALLFLLLIQTQFVCVTQADYYRILHQVKNHCGIKQRNKLILRQFKISG